MNAARGSRFILKTLEEVGVIQQLAAQNLDGHRSVAHRNLLGEKDRPHASFAQLPDNAKATGESSGKLRLGLRGLGSEGYAISWTEGKIVRVSLLASWAGLH